MERGRTSTMGRALLPLLAACTIVAAAATRAGAETVSLPVQRDTTIMEAHPRDNDGAWGYLWLKWNSARGFENRVLVEFDLAPLAARAADVLSAAIVLRASDHTFPKRGTRIATHFMDPAAPVAWSEGGRSFDHFTYCGRRDLFRPSTGEGGPGATWSCEDDGGAVDALGAASCAPAGAERPWRGGLLPAGDPDLPRGFRTLESASQVEVKGFDPLCRKALACFATSASPDCWRSVALDVTADVREALATGVHAASWLVRKVAVEAGAARFFSREGALCLLRVPELQPQLRVALADGGPPIVIDPPALDCAG